MRTRLALLALAVGGFGIGSTEFVAMGVLPQIAQNLLPGQWAASQPDAIAHAGLVISAYAAGVVVGAPLIGATLARFPRKALLLGFAIAFTVFTALSALAPTFPLVLAARFLAGLPHGAYFGIAALVAAELMGPGNRGKGIAFVLSGLATANVIGVPLITWLGQVAGWRVSYLVVAGVFLLTALAVWAFVPHQAGDPGATFRREMGALRRGQVWFALGFGAIGFGGFFAVQSYIAPMVTDLTGLPQGWVPAALVTAGLGMFVGNHLGGRFADWNAMRSVLIMFPIWAVAMLGLGLTAQWPWAAFLGFFFVAGLCGLLSPTIQTRLMEVAGESQTLAAAINHSSLNLGNSLGAALGAAVIAGGLGYRAPSFVGAGLALLGFVIATVGWSVDRRAGRLVAPEPAAESVSRV